MAMAAALVGCQNGGSPAADGPLSSGLGQHARIPKGAVCTPYGGPQTNGLQVFTNFGSTTVVLDRVVLLRPRNQRLLGSYAVPSGNFLVGNPHGWPPKDSPLPSGWKHRQPIHGFRLAAGRAFNIVLGVAPITKGLSISQGMLVYYHDSSGSYVAKNYWAEGINDHRLGC
jgi:hypothetical protein